jgi:hypothetical protein
MKLFAHSLRFERILAKKQWPKDFQGCSNQAVVRKDTTHSDTPRIGMDGDQGVDAIFGLNLIAPTTLRSCTS